MSLPQSNVPVASALQIICFERLLMTVWRAEVRYCAARQTVIGVCASPLTPNTNDLANSALQILTRR